MSLSGEVTTNDQKSPLLQLEGIVKRYGGLEVLKGCSLQVERGSITGLIGPNGAGKTTLFEITAGFVSPNAGTITLNNTNITGMPPYRISRHGMVRTFQIPREFAGMSLIDNLMVASKDQSGETITRALFMPSQTKASESMLREKAESLLEFVGLSRLANDLAGTLSGGQKKLLELARALMLDPDILLLDEPVAGVNPTLILEIEDRIKKLREMGMTFLIIEHKMEFIMEISDWIFVMAEGNIITHGKPEHVMQNQQVLDAYLGVM